MASLNFKDVTVQYPIFNSRSLSLRNQFFRISTGGLIESDAGKVEIVTALKNVSFELKDGDSIGIIGHNGAGKTTLLRTMAGIYMPTKGTVNSSGRISTVFEIGAGMDPELSGYDNIFRVGILMGLQTKDIQRIIPEIEDFTELGDFLQLPVKTYSSGMTIRLMFAVATSVKPEILLIDEMLSTGDENFQIKANQRMEHLIAESKIFVFASHNHLLLKKYCRRIFKLEHGMLSEILLTNLN